MKKLYCIICGKYRKFEKPKTSYTLQKTLVLSITCSKCKNKDEKNLEEESIEVTKNSWFDWKYIITLKIWVKNLDWKI